MTDRLRWGLVGAGWIARQFAGDLALGRTGRVTRVCARTDASAKALADGIGAATAADVAALAASEDVDVVYVASPAAAHRDHVLAVLASGKPVLCEKPFAVSAEAAREVVEAARAAGLFCMEAMWTRFLPTFREARRRVEGGSLGLVRQISADLGFPYEETVATASITGDAKGGGALLDLGVYGLSAAHLLLGRPIEIEAQGIRSETGNLRDVAILMRHAGRNGTTEAALSSIRASHGALLSNRLTIAGTTGRIELDAPFIAARGGRERSSTATRDRPPPPSGLRRRLANSPLRGVLRRLGGMDGVAFGGGYPGYGLGLQADEVARCLATGLTESPIMPLDESVAIMETLDQVGRLVARNQR